MADDILKGTLPSETTKGSVANFQNLLSMTADKMYADRPTPEEEIQRYETAGVKVFTPEAIGDVVGRSAERRLSTIQNVFQNTLNTIKEKEANDKQFKNQMLNLMVGSPFLFESLTGEDFEAFKSGNLTLDLIKKISLAAQQEQVGLKEVLSIDEAKSLGVPYGTTREQAMTMNITPRYASSGTSSGVGSFSEIPIENDQINKNLPTFEEFLQQKEFESLQSFSPEKVNELRNEYNQLKQLDTSQFDWRIQGLINGTINPSNLTQTDKKELKNQLQQVYSLGLIQKEEEEEKKSLSEIKWEEEKLIWIEINKLITLGYDNDFIRSYIYDNGYNPEDFNY